MADALRILHLEDETTDAELVERELRKIGLGFTVKRVYTRDAFLEALRDFAPNLILADYSLQGFDGLAALAIARERCQEVPFILVSGTMGEDVAIESLKAGAWDYVLKERLGRLGPAVQRALRETEERRARKQAEEDLRKKHEDLKRQYEFLLLREDRMLELKGEINALLKELGQPLKYTATTSGSTTLS